MVEDVYSQQLAGGDQLPGRIQVILARVGRSSRMIVRNDNAVSVIQDSGLEHLPWVNEAGRDGSVTTTW